MTTSLHTFISVLSLFCAYSLGMYIQRKILIGGMFFTTVKELQEQGCLNKKGIEIANKIKIGEEYE